MADPAALLLELGLVLTALSVLGALARRAALSPIPLYLLAGVALGSGGVTELPAAQAFIDTGAAIGVVLLLLVLGLEFTVDEFSTSLRRHVPSAGVDMVLNATPGAIAGWLLGLDTVGIVALAGATYISSSGIVARLLTDLRRLGNRETPAVLSVLVLEDLVMAVYLPILAVLASGGGPLQALLGVAISLAAVGIAFVTSYRWGHHVGRVLAHPDSEQLLLRVLGITMVVAALAELVHASAAVGAFLVGLALTGEAAERSQLVLNPLRDLFAAAFFLAIGISVDLDALVPLLPAALALAVVSAATKVATGWFAAGVDGVSRKGRIRAGTALIARGEFSIVIISLAGTTSADLQPLVTGYVLIVAIVGPIITRFSAPPQTGLPLAVSPRR